MVIGQVRTTVLQDGQDIGGIVPYYQANDDMESILLPEVDIEAALLADREAGIQIPRFAVQIPTNFSKSDGVIEEFYGKTIWKIGFRSAGATGLNFKLAEVNLPDEAEIYVFSKNGTMVFGPIESNIVNDEAFYTEIIKGEEAIIMAVMPSAAFESFNINIIGVGHCFLSPEVESRDYGDSQTCTIDVNCPVGAGWSAQRDAVSLTFIDGKYWCSGALLNDACQDFRSFFLTAKHCVDEADEGVSSWFFRFNYDSPNPVATTCRGSEPYTWVAFMGSTKRAEDAATDFALLELSSSAIGYPSVRYAGWDRTSYTLSSAVGIHHPVGDVKKISFSTGSITNSGFATSGSSHLKLLWGSGVTEGGSSGSPLFDGTTGLVVGQLHGHDGDNDCSTVATSNRYYGRFFTSWTGGGTSSSRLSDWLGAGGAFTDPTTTSTIQPAFISGSHTICNTSSYTYTLNYSNPGSTYTWAVTPSSYFVTASGTGNTANLQVASSRTKGKVVLDFTVTTPCGNSFTISYQMWIGPPSFEIDPIKGDHTLCTNQTGSFYLDGDLQSQFATVVWSYYGALSSLTGTGNLAPYTAASTPGTGLVYATVTNACGTS